MELLYIKLKPEAERLIAEICVKAMLRKTMQEQTVPLSVTGEVKHDIDVA